LFIGIFKNKKEKFKEILTDIDCLLEKYFINNKTKSKVIDENIILFKHKGTYPLRFSSDAFFINDKYKGNYKIFFYELKKYVSSEFMFKLFKLFCNIISFVSKFECEF